MDIESFEKVLFTIGDYEFDGLAVFLLAFILMGTLMGAITLWVAFKSKTTNNISRIYIGSLGSILLSCTSLIGMAFFQ